MTRSDWKFVRKMDTGEGDAKAYTKGRLTVIVASKPAWHLSISHPWRYPAWDEIRDARYDFIPDAVTMCMILPPKAEYLNVHPNCFHLHDHEERGRHGHAERRQCRRADRTRRGPPDQADDPATPRIAGRCRFGGLLIHHGAARRAPQKSSPAESSRAPGTFSVASIMR